MSDIAGRLESARVAPVVRTRTADTARRAVDLLQGEGFDLFELTLTTPGALELLSDLSRDASLCIGVGTVLTREDGEAAVKAGAAFIVSPAFVPGLCEIGRAAGVPVALGAATPTEVLRAHEAGADFVKIFPAAQLGGPGFVKALRSVYPMIRVMPTGGIEAENLPAYFNAGAVCVGMGGNLVNETALETGDYDTIRRAARAVRARIETTA